MGGIEADLYRLWKVGTVDLPWIGLTYSEAGQTLKNLPRTESLFTLPGSDAESPIVSSWNALRSTLQYILDESCINVLDSGIALEEIVKMYTESDLLTADEVAAVESNIGSHPTSTADNEGSEYPKDPPPEHPIPRPDDPVQYGVDPRDPDGGGYDDKPEAPEGERS